MIPSQLPIFLKVVEQGSFSAASRQCGISPAAVSKAISQLEKKMQQRLFHRSTHSLTLTQEGKVLYDKTAHLMAELEESIEASIDATQSVAGEIKINLPDHMGQTLIYPRLLEFLKYYPDVQLDLHFNDQVQDLIENGFDLGIGNSINQDSRLIARSYMDVQLVYVASPDYLEGKPLPKTPEELKGLNCIGYCSPSTGRLIPWRFVVDGKEQLLMPEGNLKVNSPGAAFRGALEGAGVACVPKNYINDEQASQLVVLLEEYSPPTFTVWLYFASRSYLPARVRFLIDFLLEESA